MQAKIRHRTEKVLRNPYVRGIVVGIIVTIVGTIIYNWSSSSPTAEFGSIRDLIRLEADLVTQKPRTTGAEEQYGNLFVEDAWIVDVATQTFWEGRAEILQRFRSLEEFKTLEHRLEQDPILTGDDSAVAQTTTQLTYVDPETVEEKSYIGHEIWTFDKIDGQWKITSLQVNIP